jgi:hypothetical protein
MFSRFKLMFFLTRLSSSEFVLNLSQHRVCGHSLHPCHVVRLVVRECVKSECVCDVIYMIRRCCQAMVLEHVPPVCANLKLTG